MHWVYALGSRRRSHSAAFFNGFSAEGLSSLFPLRIEAPTLFGGYEIVMENGTEVTRTQFQKV